MNTLETMMKLNKKLNPKLAEVVQIRHNIIRIKTSTNYIITIIKSLDQPLIHHGKKDMIVLDHKGRVLNHFLNKTPLEDINGLSYDSKSSEKMFLQILKVLTIKNKKEAMSKFQEGVFFEIKSLIIKKFNLDYKIENEYDIFSGDEYRPAYHRDVPRKNILNKKVKIMDSRVYIFNNKMVDMPLGIKYHTETRFYPDLNMKLIEVSKNDDYTDVSTNNKGKTQYLKKYIFTKEELKGQKFISLKNISNQVFTLVKSKTKKNLFALRDSDGKEYVIHHSDMRVYILD